MTRARQRDVPRRVEMRPACRGFGGVRCGAAVVNAGELCDECAAKKAQAGQRK